MDNMCITLAEQIIRRTWPQAAQHGMSRLLWQKAISSADPHDCGDAELRPYSRFLAGTLTMIHWTMTASIVQL